MTEMPPGRPSEPRTGPTTPAPAHGDGPTGPSTPTGHTAPRERFEGHDGRECGEHRTTGHRAWCYDDSEWCTQAIPCRGCELPSIRQRAEEAERALAQARDAIAAERRGRLAAEAAVRRAQALADSWSAALGVDIAHARALREALDAEQPKERDDPFATGTRYRDSHGEMWTVGSNGLMHHHSYSQRGMDAVRSEYGPLTRIEEAR